jgi:hypothetical protein
MTYYADSTERTRLITGLRDLAAFLESSPDVPAPRWADVMVFPRNGTDDRNRAEIDAIASRIGAETSDNGQGHYTASRFFGPVEYRAIAIDKNTPADSDGE